MLATIRTVTIEYIPLASARIHPPQAHISWTLADCQGGKRVFYAKQSCQRFSLLVPGLLRRETKAEVAAFVSLLNNH